MMQFGNIGGRKISITLALTFSLMVSRCAVHAESSSTSSSAAISTNSSTAGDKSGSTTTDPHDAPSVDKSNSAAADTSSTTTKAETHEPEIQRESSEPGTQGEAPEPATQGTAPDIKVVPPAPSPENNRWKSSSRFLLKMPVHLIMVWPGLVFGTPIAATREVISESQQATFDLAGSNRNPFILFGLSAFGIPAGVLSGSTRGFAVAAYHGWEYGDDRPFSKSYFSIGTSQKVEPGADTDSPLPEL